MADEERERDRRWGEGVSGPVDAAAPEEDDPALHDDIMKRLLDYQRSRREGASPEQADAEVARVSSVDTGPPHEAVLDLSAGDEQERWSPEPAQPDRPTSEGEIEEAPLPFEAQRPPRTPRPAS